MRAVIPPTTDSVAVVDRSEGDLSSTTSLESAQQLELEKSQSLALKKVRRGKGAIHKLKSGKSIPMRYKVPVGNQLPMTEQWDIDDFDHDVDKRDGEIDYFIYAIVFKIFLKETSKRRVSLATYSRGRLAPGEWYYVVFDPKDRTNRPEDLAEASRRNLYQLMHKDDLTGKGSKTQLVMRKFRQWFREGVSRRNQEHVIFENHRKFWAQHYSDNMSSRQSSNIGSAVDGVSINHLMAKYSSHLAIAYLFYCGRQGQKDF